MVIIFEDLKMTHFLRTGFRDPGLHQIGVVSRLPGPYGDRDFGILDPIRLRILSRSAALTPLLYRDRIPVSLTRP